MGAGRYRSRVRILRPRAERIDGVTVEAYDEVTRAWVEIREPKRGLQNFGAGELPAGGLELETFGVVPLQARDVVEVVGGPEAGTAWRAEGVIHPGRILVATMVAHVGELLVNEPVAP